MTNETRVNPLNINLPMKYGGGGARHNHRMAFTRPTNLQAAAGQIYFYIFI